MEKKLRYKNKESKKFLGRKGLSMVVTALLLIGLSIAAVSIVWIVANNMIKKQMQSSASCYGNYNKITINGDYTCFNKTGTDYNLRFSLYIGDTEVNKVILSVYSASSVKSYTIENSTGIEGVTMYPSGSSQIILPGKNSGLSYEISGFSSNIDSIEIAPYIGEELCGVSDSMSGIEDCSLIS